MAETRLKIAVFIDFDNIEIGVKSTLGVQFDVGVVLEALKERGDVVSKIAYGDWTRAGDYSRSLTQHAIRLVQRNMTPGGDKNGADINLALDALEMAFTHQHINAYVIVGGDSDFLSLVEKLKQYDKKVFVVGGRAFTSVILQRNCHEFIAYENLSGVRRAAASAASKGGRPVSPPALSPVTQAFPIVRRALKILADREVSPQTGLLKSTLLQLDSTFSERNYGASSFLDFTEKLAHSGLVHLKTAGRSVMVELNPLFEESGDGAEQKARATPEDGQQTPADVVQAASHADVSRQGEQSPAPAVTESAADGVRFVSDVLQKATSARWPMYIRNVKQLLRAADSAFDERRYGFGGLMDLLRACQRDNIMRLERDRRGGLRVFPGAALQRPADIHAGPPLESSRHDDGAAMDAEVDEGAGQPLMPIEAEPADHEGNVIDTTAELLGRAKPRRPRAKAPAGGAPRKAARPSGTPGPRRPPARRAARSKKAAADSGDDS